ncbi:MAG: MmgE/PrpD family protein [Candidatus Tectomicrobia bacterium]|uniref:MmgE/PrpD family protein n=1 Tax=Tectimicrobiota bacterium TaxID=2528274 RepID=A0A932GP81_UNCTE|nr:MmgE/PrpD family protein [Candidatus Tectomicrobia bacterium]
MKMDSCTQKLAEFCAGLQWAHVPATIREKITWCWADTLGIVLGAVGTPEGEKVLRVLSETYQENRQPLPAPFASSPPPLFALIHGTMADLWEFADGYSAGGIHASCTVIPAALAVARDAGSTGDLFLTAVLVGYEVANRVARAMYRPGQLDPCLATGTAGALGAAAACAKILGFNPEQTAQALGLAALLAPLSHKTNLWGGHPGKPLHAGYGARAGVEAALLTGRGFGGSPAILEGTGSDDPGFCFLGGEADLSLVTLGLGEEYTTSQVYYKPYPVCRHAHGAIDALLEISRRHKLNAAEIEAVEVRTTTRAAAFVGHLETSPASNPIECQFSLPFLMAVTLMDGKLGLEQLTSSRIADPAVHDLVRKVRLLGDPSLDPLYPKFRPTQVTVHLKGGIELTHRVDAPKGDPDAPMRRQELEEKFHSMASRVLPPSQVSHLLNKALGLAQGESLSGIFEILSTIAASPTGTTPS